MLGLLEGNRELSEDLRKALLSKTQCIEFLNKNSEELLLARDQY